MISKKSIEIVKSTVPVLETNIEEITQVFYQRLFKFHPQLKEVFNMTHQAKGSQPRALANAIFQYARYIERPEVLQIAIAAIVEKHVSLHVTPAQYEVVGTNLLAAIQEVLGEAATPEIIQAWKAAYGQLATILIEEEEKRYSKRSNEAGGFRGQKPFVVTRKVEESENITSFYLRPKDGKPAPAFIPGQYIAITVDIPGEPHKHTRNYSLSSLYNPGYLRISVKKEGTVSNYLHTQIQEGDEIMAGLPAGIFTLKNTENPVILIAGGVGITPLLSMYKHLAHHTQRAVTLIHCALHSSVQAFKSEALAVINERVQAVIVHEHPLSHDKSGVDYDAEGLLTTHILGPWLTPDTECYFCGPQGFMEHVLGLLSLLGVDDHQIFYEFFGPAGTLEKPAANFVA